MKPQTTSPASFFTALFTAACSSIGAVFCLVTAFSIPVNSWQLMLVLFALSAAFSFLCAQKHGWVGLAVLFLLSALAIWRGWQAFVSSVSVAVEAVSAFYATVFDEVEPITLSVSSDEATATAFFAVFGALLSLLNAWTVRGQNTLWLSAVCSCLPLVACLIILQSVPAAWAVLLLVGSLVLLVLSQQLRRGFAVAADTLALRLILPLAVFMLGLYACFPASSYERSAWSDELLPTVNALAERLKIFRANETTGEVQLVSPFSPSTLGSRSWDSSVRKADLSRIGPQRVSGRHVMRVYSEAEGTLYLRACALSVYDENQWLALDEDSYAQTELPENVFLVDDDGDSGVLKIETDMKSSIYYTPYRLTELPENAEPFQDAYIKNPLQSTQYQLSFSNESVSAAATDPAYRRFVHDVYTQLPEDVETFLQQTYGDAVPVTYDASLLSEIAITGYVSQLVQDGKHYQLNTPKLPEGEEFVSWWLTQSETGYCVHFATAAAVLLRHYGIPARYVTGYLVDAKQDAWTDVTQDDAHAWVEYYSDTAGWTVFDPTPAMQPLPQEEQTPEEEEPVQNTAAIPEQQEDEPEAQQPAQEESQEANQPVDQKLPVADKTQPAQKETLNLSWLWCTIWCVLGLLAVVMIWRIVVLSARKVSFTSGTSNRRAVQYYRYIQMLARLTKQTIPDELTALAEKARFSQHRLTDDELSVIVRYAESLTDSILNDATPLRRTLYRLVYVLQ